jgi:Uma2 family endonuclease
MGDAAGQTVLITRRRCGAVTMATRMSTAARKIPDLKSMDLPYLLRVYGVTEEMFDEIVEDEDTRADLIDGVLIVHSPATVEHDDLVTFIASLLRFYAGTKELGLVLGASNALVRLKMGRKVAPDVFFVSKRRVPRPLPKQFEGAPDLVIEVLSRSNRGYDLGEKRAAYQAAGVGEIWFVDADAREMILDRRRDAKYVSETLHEGRVASEMVESFWLDASWLWQSPLPDPLSCLDRILGRI